MEERSESSQPCDFLSGVDGAHDMVVSSLGRGSEVPRFTNYPCGLGEVPSHA